MRWLKGIFLSLFLYVNSSLVFGADCNKHKIYCDILTLKPDVNKKFAMKLSNLLYKYTKKYDIDPKLSVAIGMQETNFKLNKTGKRKGYLKVDNKLKLFTFHMDIGLFQFYANTIEEEGIDPDRLLVDLEYSVKEHVKFLRKRINICVKKGIETKERAWGCYHSYTKKYRDVYINDVSQHLAKI